MDVLKKEANIISKYLINEYADGKTIELYMKAVKVKSVTITQTDQKILNYLLNHPKGLPFIDAGWRILNPESEVRRRIYVMFAILEAKPEYTKLYLSKGRDVYMPFNIVIAGISSILRILIGIPFVMMIRK